MAKVNVSAGLAIQYFRNVGVFDPAAFCLIIDIIDGFEMLLKRFRCWFVSCVDILRYESLYLLWELGKVKNLTTILHNYFLKSSFKEEKSPARLLLSCQYRRYIVEYRSMIL